MKKKKKLAIETEIESTLLGGVRVFKNGSKKSDGLMLQSTKERYSDVSEPGYTYSITKGRRSIYGVLRGGIFSTAIEVSVPEMRKLLKEMEKQSAKYGAQFMHFNPELTFFVTDIKDKPCKKKTKKV